MVPDKEYGPPRHIEFKKSEWKRFKCQASIVEVISRSVYIVYHLLHVLIAFACSNRSIVLAADDMMVSWGPSPTYGELVSYAFLCGSLVVRVAAGYT